MSLTYPILNDILFLENSNMKKNIKQLQSDLLENINQVKFNHKSTVSKIDSQNTKINLIHDLFKHYKKNSNKIKEIDKLSNSNEYDNYNNLLKRLEERIIKLEDSLKELVNYYKDIVTKNNNINNVINTHFHNLNFRLNGLEEKYVELSKKYKSTSYFNKSNSQDKNNSNGLSNDSNSDDNDSNWIKVTKKHKN